MPRMPARPAIDVCIQGAGAVGATLALALSRRGFSVVLCGPERRSTPAGPDVRTYALNSASVALLQSLRVWEALPPDARTAVHEMRVAGDQGGRIEFTAWQQCVEQLAWIVDAAALDDVLAQALQYAPHVQREPGATSEPAATLLAVCEGKHSATREQLGINMPLQPYRHTAVAARLTSDRPHQGIAWQWFQSPAVLGLLPFDRPTPGHGYGLVWSLPEGEAQRWLAADEPTFEAGLQEATQGAVGTLRLASPRAAWPLVTARAHEVTGPGWVLLGDAAHAMHPLAGQGLNVGLADVAALVEVLDQARTDEPWRSVGDAKVLRRYARARTLPTWMMGTLVDGLWQVFARPDAATATLRNQGLRLVNQAGPLKRWLAARAMGG